MKASTMRLLASGLSGLGIGGLLVPVIDLHSPMIWAWYVLGLLGFIVGLSAHHKAQEEIYKDKIWREIGGQRGGQF